MLTQSGRRPIVVIQQPAETLLLLDGAGMAHMARFGAEESFSEALVWALPMVMGDELGNGAPQGLFSEQDEAVQAGFLDRAYESFGMRVEIRRARWQLHGLDTLSL